jgi:hypothetical protein
MNGHDHPGRDAAAQTTALSMTAVRRVLLAAAGLVPLWLVVWWSLA